jgi:hypothetical protein
MICRRPKPKLCSTQWVGILNGLRPRWTASRPRLLLSRWPNTTGAQRSSKATWFSISPAHAGTSGFSEEDRRDRKQLAQFGQPADGESRRSLHRRSLHDRNERDSLPQHASKKRDKEQDGRAHCFSKEQDKEQNGFNSALGTKRSDLEPPWWLSPNARNWLRFLVLPHFR